MQKKYLFTPYLIALFILFSNARAQVVLKNPILPGFYPDPAICKVGTDYYMVTSTFVYFPGIPIFHSKDLQNWKQIGSAIDRPSQMDFMGEQVSRGLFAPAINYHKGVFYITCTDIDHGGNFILTSSNPAGSWSDPVYIKAARGIDPSLFFDDQKAFILYNSDPPENKSLYSGHRTVRMYELDLATLKVVGTEKILVNGGVDISKKPVWIEAPHIYKRKDYYYLMAAEGGTSVNHSEVIFRSKAVWGPYVPYDKNPILTHRHLDPKRSNPISSVGHADLVEGPDGNTYAVFLGVRPYQGDFYNTGRETFIAPVRWVDDWPVINPDHQEVQYAYQANWKAQKQKDQLPITGNFASRVLFKDSLNNQFLFLRTHNPTWYSFKENKNALTVKLLPETILEKGNPAFIGRRQQHLLSSAAVAMDFSARKGNEKAGLIIFQNETHFYYLCKSLADQKEVVQLFKGNSGTHQMDLIKQVQLPVVQKDLYLRINAEKDVYSFWYGLKENEWQLLEDKLDGKYLSTAVAGGFVGALYGIYATAGGAESNNKAIYKWFDYKGNDPTYQYTDGVKGLKDAYKDYFPIGVAVNKNTLSGDESRLLLREFNSITPENAMKMDALHPREDFYFWKDADAMVNFAQDHRLKVRGHNLCWHEQVPDWMFKDKKGDLVTKEVLLSRLKDHITTVVKRYQGKIYAWDVLNEVIGDADDEFIRNSLWYQICGEEYIAKAFEYAHEADPQALLFYNDYNTERPLKRDKIYQLLKKLIAQNVPIHGIGLQAHWSVFEPAEKELREAIELYSSLGLQIHFTELDMSIYPWEKNKRPKKVGESEVLSPDLEQKQVDQYGKIFRIFREYKKNITSVTFWNLSDRYTWLDHYPVPGRKNYPLLFDQQLERKKAYQAVADFQ